MLALTFRRSPGRAAETFREPNWLSFNAIHTARNDADAGDAEMEIAYTLHRDAASAKTKREDF